MIVKADTHLHTLFSTDSDTPVEAQINRAIELGLSEICITDHMDHGFPVDQCPGYGENPFLLDVDAYLHKLNEIKDTTDICVNIGIECGLQTDADIVELNKELLSSHPFDQVIGSIHLIDKKDPYYPAFWEGRDTTDILKRYFEITYDNLIAFDDIDILGHLDYAVRYLPQEAVYDPKEYFELTDEILKLMIKRDIALEINTASLKKGYGVTNPHPDIIKRYYELGGRMITLGSDAHTPDGMAFGFEKCADELINIGFSEYLTFKNRKPVAHTLKGR